MIKKLILFWILGLFYVPTIAQSIVNYESYWDNYLIRNLDREDGLYRDEVYDTYQDSLGFIWIANYSFLFKYDGIKLKPYIESSYRTGIIPEIGENENGDMLLLGVEAGIHTKVQDSLFTKKSALGLTLNSLSSMSRNKGDSLFIGDYEDGLSIVYQDTVIATYDSTNGLIGSKVTKIITDEKNRVWIATTHGISVFQNGKITNFSKRNGLPDISVNALVETINGEIWAGTETEGIVVFQDFEAIRYYTKENGLTDNSVEYMEQNPNDSSIWIGFKTEGLDRFKNGSFSNLNEEEGLVSNEILSINFDRSGIGYVGTEYGLSLVIPRLIDVIDDKTIGFPSIQTNTVDQDSSGRILVGTIGGGLMTYENGDWKNIRFSKTRSNESVSAIKIADESTVYMVTSEFGIIKYQGEEILEKKNAEDGLTSPYLVCLEIDGDNNLIAGTFDGFNLINDEWEIVDTLTVDDGLPANECLNIVSDKDGDIWVATLNNGIFELKGNEVISSYDTSNGLANNRVFALAVDSQGEVWASSLEYEFYRITDTGLKTYPEIPDNFVSITEDDFGNFWFSSNGYIAHVKRADLDMYDAGEIDKIQYQRFTEDDGYPPARVNYGNSSLTKKIDTGEILITTKRGLAVINPKKTEEDRSSFFTYFDSFLIDGKSISLNEELFVQPTDKRIEVSFSALNIRAPKKTRFRTRMVGIDTEWNYVDERTTVYFDFLSNGRYTLEVSAIDQAGVWSDKTAVISFTVLPPFYKTWWFIGLCFLGFIGIGAGGVQIRSNMKLRSLNRELQTQQKLQDERERISRELHDNVGSQITNLITGIEISNLHIEKEQHQKAHSLLKNLDADARGAMTDLRETIWLLDKEEVEFGIFLDHLKGYLERQKHYLKEMNVNLDSEIDLQKILNPTQSLNLTRIIQEVLNNARKYSEADLFTISFKQTNEKLTVHLSDNGVGIELDSNTYTGNGLKNIQERAKEMGGTISIKTAKGMGTSITVTI
ncbi:MAG: hypothetical protein BalsKO_22910 [Balneolaceae bacterium]